MKVQAGSKGRIFRTGSMQGGRRQWAGGKEAVVRKKEAKNRG